MSLPIESLIQHAVTLRMYDNPVAYHEAHFESYGRWICMQCKVTFSPADGSFSHKRGCPISAEKIYIGNPHFLYVIGPNDDSILSPFTKADIEKIKEKAKTAFAPQSNQASDSKMDEAKVLPNKA